MEQILLSRPTSKPTLSVKASEKVFGRLLYIDNLRWVMIMLVVSMHAAVTYSHLGSWYSAIFPNMSCSSLPARWLTGVTG